MQVSLEQFQAQVNALLESSLPSAEERYHQLAASDPYPEILPSLLHSGHIATYAIMAGMIEPFDLAALQKPATYLVPIEGPVRYRDDKGNLQSFFLSKDPKVKADELDVRSEFVVRPNSLCYVTLRPKFRMPAYLAARFNLLIRDIYRGFLVGTGPLVDPGFVGFLSIPLHNFTSNEYILRAGEGFVYFEFTKLSWHARDQPSTRPDWLRPAINVQPPFPASKNTRRTLDDYLDQATGAGPAQNAIGEELRRFADVSDSVTKRLSRFTLAGVVGIAALVLTAVAAFLASWQLYMSSQQFVESARGGVDEAVAALNGELQGVESHLQALEQQISAQGNLVTSIPSLDDQLQVLKTDMEQARKAITDLTTRLPQTGDTGTPSSNP